MYSCRYLYRASKDTPLYVHSVARRLLRNCQKIIDVGCGIGRLHDIFPNAILIGVDVRQQAEVCLKKGYTRFFPIDLEHESLPDLGADGMVCSHVLEHFLRPERALTNALSALVHGAIVYAICPTLNNSKYWDDYTHIRPFTEESLQALMEDIGLRNVEILYELQAPFRGIGPLLRLLVRNNPARANYLASRFRLLRSRANVQAIGMLP